MHLRTVILMLSLIQKTEKKDCSVKDSILDSTPSIVAQLSNHKVFSVIIAYENRGERSTQ